MSYINFKKNIDEISQIADLLSQRGWAEGNSGNISFNISKYVDKKINIKKFKINKFKKVYTHLKDNFILATASGVKMCDLTVNLKSKIVVLYILSDGKSFIMLSLDKLNPIKFSECKHLKPTSELPTHLSIHNYINNKKRQEKFILHTHPTEIIALTQIKKFTNQNNINKLLWRMHPEMKIFLPDGVGFIPYTLSGSDKLAELTVKSLANHNAIIWEKHGCLAICEKISKAFDLIDIITKSIKIFFLCKSAGYEPEGLKKSELNKLHKISTYFK